MRRIKILEPLLVVLAIGIILVSIRYLPKPKDVDKAVLAEEKPTEQVVHDVRYGIIVDSLHCAYGKVGRNENISDILLAFDLPYEKVLELASGTKDVFDVRKIRSGNNYVAFTNNDSLNKDLLYFVYEISATKYVKYAFNDSIVATLGEKPVETRIAYAEGLIETSLWNALVESDSDPYVSVELSEVYAWVIDFFGIQKGDKFWVKYEEYFVEGEKVGVGKVLSCLMNHLGEDYYAFYYVQDSVGDYFDENANSLRRTFLKAPLRYKRISSKFSNSRLHPILKIRRPHHGVDYAAPKGTPVVSIGDGVVLKAQRSGGAGNMVKIKHNGTYTTAYLHLSGYGKNVKAGARVKQGQVIGYVGSTGLSTGAHLDFRVYKNGKAVDPLKMKSPPAKPVDSVNMPSYMLFVEQQMTELHELKKNSKFQTDES